MKCKWWNKEGFYVLGKQAIAHCENGGKCPKGVDADCNIITRKKARIVKIKAWITPPNVKEGESWIATSYKMSSDVPCTIIIERRHLKEKQDA